MLGDFEAKGEVEPAVQPHGTTQINRTKLVSINKQLVPIDVVPVETEDGLDSVFEARFEPCTLSAPEIDALLAGNRSSTTGMTDCAETWAPRTRRSKNVSS